MSGGRKDKGREEYYILSIKQINEKEEVIRKGT